jgi:hypothetical protein
MPLWIEGMVVFPHPRTVLEADSSPIPAVLLEDATTRICRHIPQRCLEPVEVEAAVQALLAEGQVEHAVPVRESAQAVVEIALVLPMVLALVFGTMAVSRVVQTQTAVIAVAHETARAGALAKNSSDAVNRMQARAGLVAPGLGLDRGKIMLEWDVSRFGGDPGEVVAVVRCPVDFSDLPMVGWISSTTTVSAEHTEWVDPFRSGIDTGSAETPD